MTISALPGVAEYCDRCENTGDVYDAHKGKVPCPACPRGRQAAEPEAPTPAPNPVTATSHAPEPDEEPCGWEPINLAAALERDGPAPPAMLERSDGTCLLYPGRAHAFIGEPEGMKSWGWQVAAAQGLAKRLAVLVIDFENDEDSVIERFRALGVHPDDILNGLTYIRPEGPWNDQSSFLLSRLRAERRFSLVVLDGVTDGMAALGLDADKNKDAATFDRRLVKPFARSGAAVVLTDHVVKDREGRGRYAIGAQHKLAAIDGATFVFEVVQPFGREREGVARIELTKDKPGWLRRNAVGKTVATLRLSSFPDGGVTGGFEPPSKRGAEPFRPTALMEKASRAIEDQPGLTKRALRSAVGGNADHADHAIELLVNEGYVRVEKGAGNARQHFSARHYRQSNDPPETEPEP